jgi:hypothetical protein
LIRNEEDPENWWGMKSVKEGCKDIQGYQAKKKLEQNDQSLQK